MQTGFYLAEGLAGRDQSVLVAEGGPADTNRFLPGRRPGRAGPVGPCSRWGGQLIQTGFYLAEGLAGRDQPVFVADGLGQLTQELVGEGMATALYHLPAKNDRVNIIFLYLQQCN